MRRGAVLCKVGGVLLCTVPTLVAVLECLPAWTKEGGAVSGLFAVLLILDRLVVYGEEKDGSGAILRRGGFVYVVWAVLLVYMLLLATDRVSTFIYFQF